MEIPLLANVLLVIGGLAIAGSVIGETPHTSPTLKRLFLKKIGGWFGSPVMRCLGFLHCQSQTEDDQGVQG